MADVMAKRQVEALRTMTAAMFGPSMQKIEGVYTVLDLCASHEELRQRLEASEEVLATCRVVLRAVLDSKCDEWFDEYGNKRGEAAVRERLPVGLRQRALRILRSNAPEEKSTPKT